MKIDKRFRLRILRSPVNSLREKSTNSLMGFKLIGVDKLMGKAEDAYYRSQAFSML